MDRILSLFSVELPRLATDRPKPAGAFSAQHFPWIIRRRGVDLLPGPPAAGQGGPIVDGFTRPNLGLSKGLPRLPNSTRR
jgi:hypothetical protein